MAKITKRTVDALKPTADRDVLVWDDELSGFGVSCRRSGAKVYFLTYRTGGGRQRWLTLGHHRPLTPDAARTKALREKAAIGDRDDPSGARQKKRRENTVAVIESVALHAPRRDFQQPPGWHHQDQRDLQVEGLLRQRP